MNVTLDYLYDSIKHLISADIRAESNKLLVDLEGRLASRPESAEAKCRGGRWNET